MENNQDNNPLMVTIRCFTYNQERYIRECLEGFVMQQTDFRFEALVHDDASTDGTADIIREYAEKYPDIIKPILETENQYSKHDGSLARVMDEHTHGKYIALCEGDDYWTDPLKLQKQFDFMESHPECSLCFHANINLYPSGEKKVYRPKVIKKYYTVKDVILGGGGFMSTNSMFYLWSFIKEEGRPAFWLNAPVGDCPNMLYYATKGKIGFINEVMSVYRKQAIGSWTVRQRSLETIKKEHLAILKMYDDFDNYTNGKYHIFIYAKKKRNQLALLKKCILAKLKNRSL